ncbi:hypothetical protein [Streptomyces sp900116325]
MPWSPLDELGITAARTLTMGHREYHVSVDLIDETSLAELAYDAT